MQLIIIVDYCNNFYIEERERKNINPSENFLKRKEILILKKFLNSNISFSDAFRDKNLTTNQSNPCIVKISSGKMSKLDFRSSIKA